MISHDRDLLNRSVGAHPAPENRKLTYFQGPMTRSRRPGSRAWSRMRRPRAKKRSAARPHAGFVDRFKRQGHQGPPGAKPGEGARQTETDRPVSRGSTPTFSFPAPESSPRLSLPSTMGRWANAGKPVLAAHYLPHRPGGPDRASGPQRQRQIHLRQADYQAPSPRQRQTGARAQIEGRLLRPASGGRAERSRHAFEPYDGHDTGRAGVRLFGRGSAPSASRATRR